LSVVNFTKYFNAERDVYVQNISNSQVVVMFETAPGQSQSYTFVPTRDPVNLTRHVPFTSVKGSMDFRKMLNRVPAVIRLLDENEYTAYYNKQAKTSGLRNIEDAIDAAEARMLSRDKLPDAPAPIKLTEDNDGPQEFVVNDEPINPRILNLCLQVSPQVPEQQKMTAPAMLNELQLMNDLTHDDWDYVTSHGYYKSVINYAKKQKAAAAAAIVHNDVEVDDSDEEQEAPPPKLAKAVKPKAKAPKSVKPQKPTEV
jgi:hypothetical protein